MPVVGLKGIVKNRSYSDANKNSGITWCEAIFKEYIKDPCAKIPNTKMIFPGIKNDKEAGDLWAYLKAVQPGRQQKVTPRTRCLLLGCCLLKSGTR
jgi:cytochrome c